MFNIKTAQQNEIVSTRGQAAPVERIFDKYIRLTLDKINLSLSDAEGRYEKDHAYRDPKPSQNWKVVKKAENVLEEQVLVWLKIGIKKVEIAEGKTEIKIPASALIEALNEMKSLVEGFQQNPQSADAKTFHAIAIQQAKPKTAPKEKYHQGKTAWEYDAESDSYIAV